MGIYDEVRSRTGSGVMVGPALSADEAHALGLSSVNPLVDELERRARGRAAVGAGAQREVRGRGEETSCAA